MSDDIVTRLRLTPVLMYPDKLGQQRIDYEACKKYINNEGVKMMSEAANEIERLRKRLLGEENAYDILRRENEHLQADRNSLALEVERLRKEAFALSANQCHAGYAGEYGHHKCREIERLRAERDEVRKSYCSLMEAYRGGDGRVTANKLGWGYLFEEDKPCQ